MGVAMTTSFVKRPVSALMGRRGRKTARKPFYRRDIPFTRTVGRLTGRGEYRIVISRFQASKGIALADS